jgi:glycosyltransferase 2 family protein
VPRGRSLSIYLSGQTMTISPGKVGEVLKSALLRRSFGTPFARSAPIVLAERVTDALGVVILAAVAALVARSSESWEVALAGLALVAAVVAAVRLPWLARVTRLAEARATALELLGPRIVVSMSLVAAASWFCECLAAYVCTRGLGLHVSLAVVALVFAVGSLAGALSFLPGGLGVAETSMTGLFLALSEITRADAAAAVVLIRVATLWFAVALGLAALALESRRYASAEPDPERRSSIR